MSFWYLFFILVFLTMPQLLWEKNYVELVFYLLTIYDQISSSMSIHVFLCFHDILFFYFLILSAEVTNDIYLFNDDFLIFEAEILSRINNKSNKVKRSHSKPNEQTGRLKFCRQWTQKHHLGGWLFNEKCMSSWRAIKFQ